MQTTDHARTHKRFWKIYQCARCGGLVLASAPSEGGNVSEIYPASTQLDESLPPTARSYLDQALNSLHAPAGAVMLAASSVDSMLKDKGYSEGTLYSRINKAAADHLITNGMAKWAHDVRLDANDQRHADQAAELPTAADARKCVDFALAFGQFLFVLPARVERGLAEARSKN